jgi:hypothetical protein
MISTSGSRILGFDLRFLPTFDCSAELGGGLLE